MSKLLTIGTCTFQYPEAGTNPGWGEEATDWAVAVTNKIATLSGPNDINTSCATIANCQCTAADIGVGPTALKFTTAGCCGVRSFVASYTVVRTDPCCVVSVEAGEMEGVFNGSTWAFNHSFVGCAGMCFTISDATGQVQYTSDATKGAGTIKYRARTIDN